MKKLFLPSAVIVVVTGCVAVKLKPGASVEVTTTNVPPVVNCVVTNVVVIPDSYTVKLDAESRMSVLEAIKAAGSKTNISVPPVLTNAPQITINPILTNVVTIPNSMLVKLDEKTQKDLDDMTNNSWFKKEAFTSALLGGLLAVCAAWVSYRLEIKRKKGEEDEFLLRMLKAIRSEMSMFNSLTNVVSTKLMETKNDESMGTFYGKTHNYFTVYEENATHLGEIEAAPSELIVRAYFRMKEMVDLYQANDMWISKYQSVQYDHTISGDIRSHLLEQIDEQMKGLTERLREAHLVSQKALSEAMSSIDTVIQQRETMRANKQPVKNQAAATV